MMPHRELLGVCQIQGGENGNARLWFENTFLQNIGDARPQVLILDGHDSHNFVELIEVAMENGIEIVELPAHTSHWLQPCDRTVFKPLKNAYNDACQQLMNNYSVTTISHSNFRRLLAKEWIKGVTCDNIKSAFRACGIYPLDPTQVPNEAYIPSSLYVIDNGATVSELSSDNTLAVQDAEVAVLLPPPQRHQLNA